MPSTEIAPQQEYIIDPIFPANEIHLVGGSSGTGKSTWLIQFLHSLSLGLPCFGYPAHPVEWSYVSCDRSWPGVNRTLDRIGLPIDRSRFHTRRGLVTPGQKASIDEIVNWCKTPLLILEAMSLLMPIGRGRDMSTYGHVGEWLEYVADLCERKKVTIIGTVHSPKVREGEKYPDIRQRVLGSVAFAALVETIILIERVSADIADPGRVLYLLPRNAPQRAVHYKVDEAGRFFPVLAPAESTSNAILDSVIESLEPGAIFESEALIVRAEARGIKKSSVYNWLKRQVEAGAIQRMGYNQYCRPAVN